MKDAYDGCSNYRHYRAEELEEQIRQEIRGPLRDPDRLRAGMDMAIEVHRAALRGDPEREAKAWLEKLAEVERKRAKYQEMAAEELITLDELRGELADLEDIRATAERELEEVRGRSHCRARARPGHSAGELRSHRAGGAGRPHPRGAPRLLPHAARNRLRLPRWLRGCKGRVHALRTVRSGPNGGASSATRRGFSINKNTRACGAAATARRAPSDSRRQATPKVRTPSRQPA